MIDEEVREQTRMPFDPIKDIARFTCDCGHWLLVFRDTVKECPGPCCSHEKCGIEWEFREGVLRKISREKSTENEA